MSQPQQAGATFRHALILTPRLWKKAVKDYRGQRGSTFEIRLRELLGAAAKAHNRQPEAEQVHFDLCPLKGKRFRLQLVLSLLNRKNGLPYLLLSLKEEWPG
ncbi:MULTISPECIES: hypothetical protein [Pseudomonas]|uniref:Uncharacterized protein n=1 Tax=Pseudomonas asplenii TaxID=53407 RepID=A0A0M9GG26_9PSED|nr:hypothetical protein [Pseudomonas fuscovaginae]KPA90103.1 hypothetical protein PF66_03236 [Pseudomonas fuscovaginae]KPA95045.1 hypothetical protein PF70_04965 [Pseudomonas fuscovaginae]